MRFYQTSHKWFEDGTLTDGSFTDSIFNPMTSYSVYYFKDINCEQNIAFSDENIKLSNHWNYKEHKIRNTMWAA